MARPVVSPGTAAEARRPFSVRLAACLPLLALAVLLLTLAHNPSRPDTPDSVGTDPFHDVSLMLPDARVSPSKAILLQNQYHYFLRFQHDGLQSHARQDAVRKYNLFTAECSPDVFLKTGLPHSVR